MFGPQYIIKNHVRSSDKVYHSAALAYWPYTYLYESSALYLRRLVSFLDDWTEFEQRSTEGHVINTKTSRNSCDWLVCSDSFNRRSMTLPHRPVVHAARHTASSPLVISGHCYRSIPINFSLCRAERERFGCNTSQDPPSSGHEWQSSEPYRINGRFGSHLRSEGSAWGETINCILLIGFN